MVLFTITMAALLATNFLVVLTALTVAFTAWAMTAFNILKSEQNFKQRSHSNFLDLSSNNKINYLFQYFYGEVHIIRVNKMI